MSDYQLPERYALDDDPVLGEGGMGRVLRARDVVLDMPVALKIVRPDLAADVRFRKLFDLEVRISARFTHPHIVPLHDLGELGDGTPYLGLALADAGSFAGLRDDCPAWPELLRLTLELLDALGHLHARDVLHRDLKPENVLLWTGQDGKPHVWLADLGLANASGKLAKKKGRVEGTPGFMAPEQRLGMPREYGPWTDLYPLGVMIWELVTGKLPFPHGKNAMDADLPGLSPRKGLVVPEGLELILANLLNAEPMSRYDLAADLRTELLALGEPTLTGDNVPDGEESAPSRPRFGTVAPSMPQPSRSTNTADGEVEAVSVFNQVPIWNRPAPEAMPEVPPPETGQGATARASLQLFALRELPLVARDDARQELWSAAREVARTGIAKVVLLVGEAGSGKSHVVENVVRALEEGGWAEGVVLHHSREGGNEDGYAGAARGLIKPWNESRASLVARLRRRLGRAWGALDAEVKEEADMLARWSGVLEEGEEEVAEGYGLREVYRFLEARAWRGLSYLLIEDAQWATEEGDGLSIAEAVLQSAADGEKKQLLVLVTLRAEDLSKDAALAKRVAELVETGAVRVELPRLDRKGTEALLAECLTLAPRLASKVAARCEGNPLFARQLLIEWASRGWLVDTGGLQFGLDQGVDADAVLPADAQALFRDRVDQLAEASGNSRRFRDALHMAAMAGVTIPRELLLALAGSGLEEFVRGCGLWVDREDLVKFDHGLLHQAVLDLAEQRKDAAYLHRRLAKAWSRYGTETGDNVDFEVGRHAYNGRYYPFAVTHLLRASEAAWARGRTKELEEAAKLAVDACEQAEKLRPKAPWAQLWRARAFEARGAAQEAGEAYSRAKELFGDDDAAIAATIGMGWAARQSGELDRAEAFLSEAMNAARSRGDRALEAKAIAGKAWVEQQKRNFEGADILFTRVMNRFNQLEDVRGAAEAALGQAFVARRTGEFDDADELYEEAAESFQEGDDLLGVARALHGRAVVARQRREPERAEELYRESLGIAEDLGATWLMMECRVGLAELERLQGELDRAQRRYEAHAAWAERQGVFEAAIFAKLGLAAVAFERGDLDAMYDFSNEAAEYLNKVPGHWLWAAYRLTVAALLARRRDEESTYRWLWSASELGLADTVDEDIARYLSAICDVAHEEKWLNVMRVAGKLGTAQWDALGVREASKKMRTQLAEIRG